MSSATEQIFDLYGVVGLEVDQSSWTKVQQRVYKFHRDMQRRLDNIDPPTMRIQKFGDVARRAAAPLAALGSRLATAGKIGFFGLAAGAVAATRDALSFDRILNELDRSSDGAVGNLGALRKQFLATSTATGVAKEDVADLVKGYITLTGDAKTATASADVFARVMKGQGASAEDVAGSAAAMSQQFGITSGEMEQMFSILSAGGKAGKIELRDMAAHTAELGAGFKKFGGAHGLDAVNELGAVFQVAARNFGNDAGQAATGVESLMGGIQQINKAKMKAAGVKGFTQYEKDGKTLKPLLEIIDEISAKNLNGTQLFSLLGRKEAVNTYEALRDNRKAVDDIARATRHAKNVAVDFAKEQASASGRVTAAWNTFKNKIAEVFTPERIEKMADAFGFVLESVIELGEGIEFWVIEPIMDAIDAITSFGERALSVGKKFGLTTAADLVGGVGAGGNVASGLFAGDKVSEAVEYFEKKERGGAFAKLHESNQGARIDRLAARGRAIVAGDSVPRAPGAAPVLSPQTVINVTGGPGMDPEALAAKVVKKFDGYLTQKIREATVGSGG